MSSHPVLNFTDGYRRAATARRTPRESRRLLSQDASRYQARNMPPPTYDLDREDVPASLLTILVLTLAVVATGAGIVLIDHIGTWLGP